LSGGSTSRQTGSSGLAFPTHGPRDSDGFACSPFPPSLVCECHFCSRFPSLSRPRDSLSTFTPPSVAFLTLRSQVRVRANRQCLSELSRLVRSDSPRRGDRPEAYQPAHPPITGHTPHAPPPPHASLAAASPSSAPPATSPRARSSSPGSPDRLPRVGAFEVWVAVGGGPPVRIFSKLRSGRFPRPEAVAVSIYRPAAPHHRLQFSCIF
jgi:hypothetical protein